MATTSIIDIPAVSRIVSGDVGLLRELVHIFKEELPGMTSTLVEAFRKGDSVAAAVAAHRLKGSLSALGARCCSTAEQLEASARKNSLASAQKLFVSFQSELGQVVPALEEVIAKETL